MNFTAKIKISSEMCIFVLIMVNLTWFPVVFFGAQSLHAHDGIGHTVALLQALFVDSHERIELHFVANR